MSFFQESETMSVNQLSVLFLGRKRVAASALEWLLTRPDVRISAVVTDSHLEVSPTREVALSAGLPCLTLEEAHTAIREDLLHVDLAFSLLYWRILPSDFLSRIKLGTINFHPAPLPDYKGVGGYNLAILHSLSRWACTAHYIDECVDTGPIIDDEWFDIDLERETALSLEKRSQTALKILFERVASAAIGNRTALSTRPNGAGRLVTRTMLEQMKVIDSAADDIPRKIRAFWFPPYDGAYVVVNGIRYTLVSRHILQSLADPAASSLFSPSSRS
jgi:methionyl-tRNA formyltransferase